MTIRTFSLWVATLLAANANAQSLLRSNAHIGFIYPLSTNGARAVEYTNLCSIHALAGVSRAEDAFCASGVASIIKDSARGLVASGVVNVVGGDVNGLEVAGVVNLAGGHVDGVQAAGIVNVSNTVRGAQLSGFGNVAFQNVKGLQASGFINVADTATTQIAGFINIAQNSATQTAGFVNIAEQVNGSQIAGFINIAERVKGVQLAGFINIADSSDHPIGIINISRSGEQAIGLHINEIGTTLATFRSGGRVLYGIIGVGVNNINGYRAYGLQAGMGAHLPVSRHFRFNGELTVTSLSDRRFNTDIRSGFRIMPTLRVGRVEVFAGPSINYTLTNDIQGVGRVGYSVWEYTSLYMDHDLSLGFEGGIQYHLDSRKLYGSIIRQKKSINE